MNAPVIIGNCTLYLGDCREILAKLDAVDAVVTDPPYGIGRSGKPKSTSRQGGGHKGYPDLGWDSQRPDKQMFETILRMSTTAIIWGGNYFADLLPAESKWLIWDKMQRLDQADVELAWSNIGGAARSFSCSRAEIGRDGAVHPTQKPIRLMAWCLAQIPDALSILDPFMGAGSTGVACAISGRQFIGIEREGAYFDTACQRIRDAYRQPDMFHEAASKPVQASIFSGDAA